MFSAGYSTQVTQENQQNVVAFIQYFAENNWIVLGVVQHKIWSGCVNFHKYNLR
jgi:N-acetylmuramoyl-L-alanine amidase CwlA